LGIIYWFNNFELAITNLILPKLLLLRKSLKDKVRLYDFIPFVILFIVYVFDFELNSKKGMKIIN